MNTGMTVVLCIVGTLVFCEVVLSRAFAALQKWLWERAKKAAEKAAAVDPNDPQPVSNADSRSDGYGGLAAGISAVHASTEGSPDMPSIEGQPPTTGHQQPIVSDYPPTASGQAGETRLRWDDAQRLWDEARAMKLPFLPDWDVDRGYLTKVYAAARLGHLEAMVELGDYAYRRGAIVEAFYWTILAELEGAEGLDEALWDMRMQWLAEGCPEEFENDYEEFTEAQADFARAVLRLQCEIDPQYAIVELQELADAGYGPARMFLCREEESSYAPDPEFREEDGRYGE